MRHILIPPTIEEVETSGVEIDNYPVDESQTVSNAGVAVVYRYYRERWQIITWNDNAVDHVEGSRTMSRL